MKRTECFFPHFYGCLGFFYPGPGDGTQDFGANGQGFHTERQLSPFGGGGRVNVRGDKAMLYSQT